jgi:hypothetical protein
MTITLEDATRPRDPSSSHAFPEMKGEAKLTAARTLAEELLVRFLSGGAVSETSFEPGSRGGYARTVTGTIAHLDEQGETFMVRATESCGASAIPMAWARARCEWSIGSLGPRGSEGRARPPCALPGVRPTRVVRSRVSATLDAGVPAPRRVFPHEGRLASATGADPCLVRSRHPA